MNTHVSVGSDIKVEFEEPATNTVVRLTPGEARTLRDQLTWAIDLGKVNGRTRSEDRG